HLGQNRCSLREGCRRSVCSRFQPRQWRSGLRIQVQKMQEVRQGVPGKSKEEKRYEGLTGSERNYLGRDLPGRAHPPREHARFGGCCDFIAMCRRWLVQRYRKPFSTDTRRILCPAVWLSAGSCTIAVQRIIAVSVPNGRSHTRTG